MSVELRQHGTCKRLDWNERSQDTEGAVPASLLKIDQCLPTPLLPRLPGNGDHPHWLR